MSNDVTRWLERWRGGDREALERLAAASSRGSLGYRMGEFLRRHRLAVAASAAVVAALVVGLLFAVSGLLRARRAEAAALRDAETSRQVSDLLVGIFQVSDPSSAAAPGEARGATVTARELLDRGAERVRTQLAGRPEVQGNLLRTMGRAYSQLGLYERAQALFESDLALRRKLHGADHPEVAVSLTMLSESLTRQGEYRRAKELSLQALAIQDQRGVEGLATGRTLSALGVADWQLGDVASARALLARSLAIQERVLGREDPDLGAILNNLAIVRWQTGDLAGADRLSARVLALREKAPDSSGHLNLKNALKLRAQILRDLGRAGEAESLEKRAAAL